MLVAFVPGDLTRLHDGRLWVRLACLDAAGEPLAGWLSVMRFSTSHGRNGREAEQPVIELERLIADRDASRRQQAAQISELEQQLSERDAKLGELERTLKRRQIRGRGG